MSDPRVVSPQRVESVPPDPLRLCVFATIALISWIAGPIAVVVFGTIGFVGYLRARRAGLLRSRCVLGDTRIVLLYLACLVAWGIVGILIAFGGGRLGV